MAGRFEMMNKELVALLARKPKLRKFVLSITDLLTKAVLVEDQRWADIFLAAMTHNYMERGDNPTEEDAKRQAIMLLGYHAGAYDSSMRVRVERFYGAKHPIFGSVIRGIPRPEQAVALGKKSVEVDHGVWVEFEMPEGCWHYDQLEDDLTPKKGFANRGKITFDVDAETQRPTSVGRYEECLWPVFEAEEIFPPPPKRSKEQPRWSLKKETPE